MKHDTTPSLRGSRNLSTSNRKNAIILPIWFLECLIKCIPGDRKATPCGKLRAGPVHHLAWVCETYQIRGTWDVYKRNPYE